MQNTKIFLDIETIPTQRQDLRDYIANGVTHPGNISKPETIAKWNEESKPAAIEDAIGKTGLDGAFGQVVCIGLDPCDDGDPDVISGLDERDVLMRFNSALDNIPMALWTAMTVIGHNVLSFDLRFLLQRYMVNGIKTHPIINVAANAKPWDNKVYDTMLSWCPDRDKRISLDKLCVALGVPSPKGDMDGSMVAQYVADGRIEEVAAYCRKDVIATRAVYKRMTFSAAE